MSLHLRFFFALLILNAKVKNLNSTYCIRMIITMSRNNVSYRMGLCLALPGVFAHGELVIP